MKTVLDVHQLTKVYAPQKKGDQPFTAVNGISFQLHQGEILGLLGPNGAGKSTTISMLLGVTSATSGSITILGKNFATDRSEILQNMTFASTYIKMPWRLTIWENLRIYALLYGLGKAKFEKRAKYFLDLFEVWNQRHKTMNDLSAGQITRVMLAKAFIPHPAIVLLDEPTASLDPDIAHQVRKFVKHQQREFNTSILYTSHNMDEVEDVCDRVMFMKDGEIIASDTPQKLVNSLSLSRMRLWMHEHLDKTQKLAQEYGYETEVARKEIEITIDEQKIAHFLRELGKQNIHYSHITIQKPKLEDYFLHLSQKE